jgi:hypothetical protein
MSICFSIKQYSVSFLAKEWLNDDFAFPNGTLNSPPALKQMVWLKL